MKIKNLLLSVAAVGVLAVSFKILAVEIDKALILQEKQGVCIAELISYGIERRDIRTFDQPNKEGLYCAKINPIYFLDSYK